jgi:hypothetical protein
MFEWHLESARRMLPQTVYFNPGGFKGKWEIPTVGKEALLLIPHQFMEQAKLFRLVVVLFAKIIYTV